jgi:hypothetical protein
MFKNLSLIAIIAILFTITLSTAPTISKAQENNEETTSSVESTDPSSIVVTESSNVIVESSIVEVVSSPVIQGSGVIIINGFTLPIVPSPLVLPPITQIVQTSSSQLSIVASTSSTITSAQRQEVLRIINAPMQMYAGKGQATVRTGGSY